MALRRFVVAALSAATAFAVIAATPAIASTAFTVSGTRTFHPPPYPEQLLPDHFAGDTISRIDYPAAVLGMDSSIAVAVSALRDGLLDTPGPMVLAGFSQGAIAVAYAKQAVMALPADLRPAAQRLSFLAIGDPTGPQGILRMIPFRIPVLGLTPFAAPETPYDTLVVNGEYDGWADFPDRPWNLISLANALMGTAYVHGRYETLPGGLDLAAVPAANITTVTNGLGATTTTYLIPTAQLPLLQPLRDIGVPEPIVAAIEVPLKAVVDAGYTRHDAKPPATQPISGPRHRGSASSPVASSRGAAGQRAAPQRQPRAAAHRQRRP